jgi:D-alanyl-D-alanine carboxypeptidase (penicillin-binding protein 5/6)
VTAATRNAPNHDAALDRAAGEQTGSTFMTRRFWLAGFLGIGLLLAALQAQPAALADPMDAAPSVSAKAWAIADGKTGKLLWGAKQDEPRVIASITKIMTAWLIYLLALEAPAILDEMVLISEKADKTGGSTAGLKKGEKYVVRDLLHGLMLPSGNDAAVALAEHFGPRFAAGAAAKNNPVALFVSEMNRKAQSLKMVNTKYFDPHGNSKNSSSPAEVLRLTWHALQNPAFARCVGTATYKCEATGADGNKRPITWKNTNRLLASGGFDGVKTGTTGSAGSCLVSSGWHGKDRLLVVVLGSTSNDNRYLDTRALFRWAWHKHGHSSPTKAA